MVKTLVARLDRLEQRAATTRFGQVVRLDPLTVKLGGGKFDYTDVRSVIGVGLAVGDHVLALARGHDITVVGKVTATEVIVNPPTTWPLTVTKGGTGSGTVTGGGATWPGSHDYNAGFTVLLTATPAAGSTFTGWIGDGTGDAPRQILMDGSRSVQAIFDVPVAESLFRTADLETALIEPTGDWDSTTP